MLFVLWFWAAFAAVGKGVAAGAAKVGAAAAGAAKGAAAGAVEAGSTVATAAAKTASAVTEGAAGAAQGAAKGAAGVAPEAAAATSVAETAAAAATGSTGAAAPAAELTSATLQTAAGQGAGATGAAQASAAAAQPAAPPTASPQLAQAIGNQGIAQTPVQGAPTQGGVQAQQGGGGPQLTGFEPNADPLSPNQGPMMPKMGGGGAQVQSGDAVATPQGVQPKFQGSTSNQVMDALNLKGNENMVNVRGQQFDLGSKGEKGNFLAKTAGQVVSKVDKLMNKAQEIDDLIYKPMDKLIEKGLNWYDDLTTDGPRPDIADMQPNRARNIRKSLFSKEAPPQTQTQILTGNDDDKKRSRESRELLSTARERSDSFQKNTLLLTGRVGVKGGSANIKDVDAVMGRVLGPTAQEYSKHNTPTVITSGTDRPKGHNKPSLHRPGYGLDFRGRALNRAQGSGVAENLNQRFQGQGFTFVWEQGDRADFDAKNHLHVEYDTPKSRGFLR